MREDQLNIKMMSQVFDVFPNSVIVIADDGSVETADQQSGKFFLQVYLLHKVKGNPLNQKNQSAASFPLAVNPQMMSPNVAVTPTTTNTSAPKGVSIKIKRPAKPPGVSSKEAMEWTKTIKVNVVSHGELKRFSNFSLALTDATAAISHVANQLSCEVFGGKK
uniref:Uncharacterized protein n=1 Tax=Amphimedon queenslandica TaxID=400682 RepID=A0A1X7UU69_AMPQE